MKTQIVLAILVAALLLSMAHKGEAVTWEFLRLEVESTRDPDGKTWTHVWVERNSPEPEAEAIGVFLWPSLATNPSDVLEKVEHQTIQGVLWGVESVLEGALGQSAPEVLYQEAELSSGKKETLWIGGRRVKLISIPRELINLILKEGWEPMALDNYFKPDNRVSTDRRESIYTFKRPFIAKAR